MVEMRFTSPRFGVIASDRPKQLRWSKIPIQFTDHAIIITCFELSSGDALPTESFV